MPNIFYLLLLLIDTKEPFSIGKSGKITYFSSSGSRHHKNSYYTKNNDAGTGQK